MDKLFTKYFYKKDSILNKNEIWNEIKKDKDYDAKTMPKRVYDEWLTKQQDVQVEKVNNAPTIQHTISAAPNSYQIDLTFYDAYERINKGYSAIFCAVEITTKKAYAYPLKSKEADAVFEVFLRFKKDAKIIDLVEMDKGSEFNKIVKYCDANNISTYIVNGDKNSMAVVERFNRSLRNYIKKICKDKVWYKKLSKVIDAYNDKKHSATGYTPNFLDAHPKQTQQYRYDQIWDGIPAKLALHKFKIGDKVRVYKKKTLFGKGSGKYSDTLHTITDIVGNSIILDNDMNKKYRYYNVLKISGEVQVNPNTKKDDAKVKEVEKNYKIARKLHKELGEKGDKVKDTNRKLQEIVNAPKVKRISKKRDILDL